MTTIDIVPFIEKLYKNYSLYILENRAIPDWSGLKRSQIKCLWVANKHCRKWMKTYALTGAVALHGGYHHAPTAMDALISGMAQDFPNGNNYPLFEGHGAFGSQTVPDGIAASRYTEVRLHKNFDALFPSIDFNIVPASPDPENPEPLYLAPILPITLVNGCSGIAVAYASKIFPRDIKQLIKLTISLLQGKTPQEEPLPYFKGYLGNVTKIDDKVIINGKIEKGKPGIIRIVEVPFKYTLETYKQFLYSLKDEEKIFAIVEDNSSDKFDITIRVSEQVYNLPEESILDFLDLRMNLNENLTIIGIDKNVKTFDNVTDYLKYFIDIRLSLYEQRRKYLIQEINDEIITLTIKSFISHLLSQTSKITKDKIIEELYKKYNKVKQFFKNIEEENIISQLQYEERCKQIVNSIRLVESTAEKLDEYANQIDELVKSREELVKITPTDMYIKDLKQLQISI